MNLHPQIRLGAALLIHATMGLVFLAGVAKSIDMSAFRTSIDSWSFIPSALRDAVAMSVPLLEIGIASAWFLGLWRLTAAWAMFGVLLVFTLILSIHVVTGRAPDCQCFGKLLAWEKGIDGARAAILRNIVLGGALLGGIWAESAPRPVAGAPPPLVDSGLERLDQRGSRKGVTLIETIIAIGLIAVLLSLFAPSLGSVRDRAHRVGSLANLRQHVANFASYSFERRGEFPRYTDPHATYSVIRHPRVTLRATYFEGHNMWNVALADYYGDNPFSESFVPPGYSGGFVGGEGPSLLLTPYFYAHAFIAARAYWNLETRRSGVSQWVVTRQHEVQSPSQKGLILDIWSYSGTSMHFPTAARSSVLIGFVDGSSSEVARANLGAPCIQGAGIENYPIAMPVMHTLNGVEGRDIR